MTGIDREAIFVLAFGWFVALAVTLSGGGGRTSALHPGSVEQRPEDDSDLMHGQFGR